MRIEDVNQELIIDKLCERWVVEKTGVELYGLAIERARVEGVDDPIVEHLVRFQAQEHEHEEMLEEVIRRFGRDPKTEESRSAQVARRSTAGLVETCRSADATFVHILEAILTAELVDGVGWKMLEDLVSQIPFDEDVVRAFRSAERTEKEHLHVIQTTLERLTRAQLVVHDDAQPTA